MNGVRRVYVEKKEPFAVAAKQLKEDIKGFLGIEKIKNVRILIRLPDCFLRAACRHTVPRRDPYS